MAPKNRNLLLSMIIIIFLATGTGSISAIAASPRLSLHSANTQGEATTLIHGNITAAINHKPFGGESIGTYSVILSGQKVWINIHLHKLPESGNIFEAQLVDTKAKSMLSLGKVGAKSSTLPVSQNIMSLFSYNQIIIITRQSAVKTSDSRHSQPVGGAALQAPFGNNFIF
jgi:hypothetical protein